MTCIVHLFRFSFRLKSPAETSEESQPPKPLKGGPALTEPDSTINQPKLNPVQKRQPGEAENENRSETANQAQRGPNPASKACMTSLALPSAAADSKRAPQEEAIPDLDYEDDEDDVPSFDVLGGLGVLPPRLQAKPLPPQPNSLPSPPLSNLSNLPNTAPNRPLGAASLLPLNAKPGTSANAAPRAAGFALPRPAWVRRAAGPRAPPSGGAPPSGSTFPSVLVSTSAPVRDVAHAAFGAVSAGAPSAADPSWLAARPGFGDPARSAISGAGRVGAAGAGVSGRGDERDAAQPPTAVSTTVPAALPAATPAAGHVDGSAEDSDDDGPEFGPPGGFLGLDSGFGGPHPLLRTASSGAAQPRAGGADNPPESGGSRGAPSLNASAGANPAGRVQPVVPKSAFGFANLSHKGPQKPFSKPRPLAAPFATPALASRGPLQPPSVPSASEAEGSLPTGGQPRPG